MVSKIKFCCGSLSVAVLLLFSGCMDGEAPEVTTEGIYSKIADDMMRAFGSSKRVPIRTMVNIKPVDGDLQIDNIVVNRGNCKPVRSMYYDDVNVDVLKQLLDKKMLIQGSPKKIEELKMRAQKEMENDREEKQEEIRYQLELEKNLEEAIAKKISEKEKKLQETYQEALKKCKYDYTQGLQRFTMRDISQEYIDKTCEKEGQESKMNFLSSYERELSNMQLQLEGAKRYQESLKNILVDYNKTTQKTLQIQIDSELNYYYAPDVEEVIVYFEGKNYYRKGSEDIILGLDKKYHALLQSKFPIKIKFGDTYKISYNCPDVVEVLLKTDKGEFTYSF
ncbi:hypothetical protein B6S12_06510 [Helicobacter valdiviensis]|uniref:Lipoprotein n=1 Tax=Helicobacter valdiviensis TaxID=1458358 RepID=A0A2W6PMP4_9HELI|nr:hypothetical protein [Helicobacter valdiviensis]PZT47963.1 hypothetical protein B6S12_06510 [Helicobacter valdiviensis]